MTSDTPHWSAQEWQDYGRLDAQDRGLAWADALHDLPQTLTQLPQASRTRRAQELLQLTNSPDFHLAELDAQYHADEFYASFGASPNPRVEEWKRAYVQAYLDAARDRWQALISQS